MAKINHENKEYEEYLHVVQASLQKEKNEVSDTWKEKEKRREGKML